MKYSKELRVLFGALLIIQASCSNIACFNALLYSHEKIQTCALVKYLRKKLCVGLGLGGAVE